MPINFLLHYKMVCYSTSAHKNVMKIKWAVRFKKECSTFGTRHNEKKNKKGYIASLLASLQYCKRTFYLTTEISIPIRKTVMHLK